MSGKKISLHKGLSRDEVAAVAEQTLASRGIKAPQPGDTMPDGTKFAGISSDTCKPIYTTPADAPKLMNLRDAESHARTLEDHGHKDWRLPSQAELQVLYDNRAAIGGFEGKDYWSSGTWGKAGLGAWGHDFATGEPKRYLNLNTYSLRCVR
jgi:hypothetical protein